MTIIIEPKMYGRYRIRAGVGDKVRIDTPWFNNLITEAGLERMGSQAYNSGNHGFEPMLRRCRVGAGTREPMESDTSLENQIATTTTLQQKYTSTADAPPYFGKKTIVYRFGEGEAAGNVSEIGVGELDVNAPLFSRALVLDGNGDPTTITILPDEWLDVVYELRCYAPTEDVVVAKNINGTEHLVTVRALAVTSTNHWANSIGSIASRNNNQTTLTAFTGGLGDLLDSTPKGSMIAPSSGVSMERLAYEANTRRIDLSATFALTQGNGAIRSVWWSTNYGAYQMELDPPLEKKNTEILNIVVRLAWARKILDAP